MPRPGPRPTPRPRPRPPLRPKPKPKPRLKPRLSLCPHDFVCPKAQWPSAVLCSHTWFQSPCGEISGVNAYTSAFRFNHRPATETVIENLGTWRALTPAPSTHGDSTVIEKCAGKRNSHKGRTSQLLSSRGRERERVNQLVKASQRPRRTPGAEPKMSKSG